MTEPADVQWQWDRKVPIALIVTLMLMFAGQSAAALWWVSKVDSRVEVLEKAAMVNAPQADRLTRLEVKVESVQAGIGEIKSILREGRVVRPN